MRSRLSLALGAWERRSELARRVHTILRARNRQIGSKPAAALAATVIAALLGGTTALTRTPEFVTFTTPITSLAESSPITLNPDKSLFHETTFKVPAQTECPRYGAAPCALPGVTANTTQKPKVRVIKLAIKRHAAHLTPNRPPAAARQASWLHPHRARPTRANSTGNTSTHLHCHPHDGEPSILRSRAHPGRLDHLPTVTNYSTI